MDASCSAPRPGKRWRWEGPLVDPDGIYFREAEDIGPHAIAFAQVMFAHSEFEREVCSLQGVITNDLSFGERRSNQWRVHERPERVAKLIKTHLGDDLQEAEPIVKLLSDAIGPCDQRNFLAHGEWWSFNTRTLTPLGHRPCLRTHLFPG